MLIRRQYDPDVGLVIPTMIGLKAEGSTVLTKTDALLREDVGRTVISTRHAEEIGLPIPTLMHQGAANLNVLIRGDSGWALFTDVHADVTRVPPAGVPNEAGIGWCWVGT